MPRDMNAIRRTVLFYGLAHTLAVLILAILTSPCPADHIYWTDSTKNTIERSNLDGSDVEIVLEDRSYPEGIVADVSGNRLFWTEGDGSIWVSELEGSNPIALLEDVGTPSALDIDFEGGKIYWTDVATGSVGRMNLDGSAWELLAVVEGHSRGIALDVPAGKFYVTGGLNSKVQRANLDGTDLEDLVTGLIFPLEIALDLDAGRMYFADRDGIHRAALDGSNQELFLPIANLTSGMELGRDSERIYFSNLGAPYIQRVDIDGTNLETLVPEGPLRPRHLTLGFLGPSTVGSSSASALGGFVESYPNPFVHATRIRYSLPGSSTATLDIRDVAGRSIRVLNDAGLATTGEWIWDGRDRDGRPVPTGVYFCSLLAGSDSYHGTIVRTR